MKCRKCGELKKVHHKRFSEFGCPRDERGCMVIIIVLELIVVGFLVFGGFFK